MQCGGNLPHTKVRLTFVNSTYMMERSTPSMTDICLKKRFFKEPVQYSRKLRRAFATDSYGFSDEKKNSFVLVSRSTEEDSSPLATMSLLLFKIDITGRK